MAWSTTQAKRKPSKTKKNAWLPRIRSRFTINLLFDHLKNPIEVTAMIVGNDPSMLIFPCAHILRSEDPLRISVQTMTNDLICSAKLQRLDSVTQSVIKANRVNHWYRLKLKISSDDSIELGRHLMGMRDLAK